MMAIFRHNDVIPLRKATANMAESQTAGSFSSVDTMHHQSVTAFSSQGHGVDLLQLQLHPGQVANVCHTISNIIVIAQLNNISLCFGTLWGELQNFVL